MSLASTRGVFGRAVGAHASSLPAKPRRAIGAPRRRGAGKVPNLGGLFGGNDHHGARCVVDALRAHGAEQQAAKPPRPREPTTSRSASSAAASSAVAGRASASSPSTPPRDPWTAPPRQRPRGSSLRRPRGGRARRPRGPSGGVPIAHGSNTASMSGTIHAWTTCTSARAARPPQAPSEEPRGFRASRRRQRRSSPSRVAWERVALDRAQHAPRASAATAELGAGYAVNEKEGKPSPRSLYSSGPHTLRSFAGRRGPGAPSPRRGHADSGPRGLLHPAARTAVAAVVSLMVVLRADRRDARIAQVAVAEELADCSFAGIVAELRCLGGVAEQSPRQQSRKPAGRRDLRRAGRARRRRSGRRCRHGAGDDGSPFHMASATVGEPFGEALLDDDSGMALDRVHDCSGLVRVSPSACRRDGRGSSSRGAAASRCACTRRGPGRLPGRRRRLSRQGRREAGGRRVKGRRGGRIRS